MSFWIGNTREMLKANESNASTVYYEFSGIGCSDSVRTIGVQDVIRPVCLQNVAVGVEVAMVCRDAIGAVKNCEEIRQQVNQHQRPGRE